jgi:hypothetical protein
MRTALLVALMLAASPLFGGCVSEPNASEPEPTFQTLVAQSEWSAVARDEDPFITDLDAAPECVGPGFRVEQQWLEIDTAECNWVTLAAPARFTVERGQELRVSLSHFDLNAPAAAEGVAELTFRECDAWSKLVAIPSAAALYTETFASPCEVAARGRVYFHLHNHGQNNWQLQDVSVLR